MEIVTHETLTIITSLDIEYFYISLFLIGFNGYRLIVCFGFLYIDNRIRRAVDLAVPTLNANRDIDMRLAVTFCDCSGFTSSHTYSAQDALICHNIWHIILFPVS
jgi:hypothetical protein